MTTTKIENVSNIQHVGAVDLKQLHKHSFLALVETATALPETENEVDLSASVRVSNLVQASGRGGQRVRATDAPARLGEQADGDLLVSINIVVPRGHVLGDLLLEDVTTTLAKRTAAVSAVLASAVESISVIPELV